jgi:16S rRNA (cytosine1402-N4)-methyltransferase
MTSLAHTPVMVLEVMATLEPREDLTFIDATFGAGGYSRALLAAGAKVLAFDRDPSVRAFAAPLETQGRFSLTTAPFSRIDEFVKRGAVDGVAFDLGVSSMQMDEAGRGFSLRRDGPLDMRMGSGGVSAAELVNTAEGAELVRIFRDYGEERQAKRIAAAIIRRRLAEPFARTLDLAGLVEQALGGRRAAKIHPATRVFQALRIAVNDELGELTAGLAAAERVLKAGGRLAVVTFHSLEDRIVKTFLAERSGSLGRGSRHAPPAEIGPAPTFLLPGGGAQKPTPSEIAANPRARSAKLRAAARTAAAPWRLAA